MLQAHLAFKEVEPELCRFELVGDNTTRQRTSLQGPHVGIYNQEVFQLSRSWY